MTLLADTSILMFLTERRISAMSFEAANGPAQKQEFSLGNPGNFVEGCFNGLIGNPWHAIVQLKNGSTSQHADATANNTVASKAGEMLGTVADFVVLSKAADLIPGVSALAETALGSGVKLGAIGGLYGGFLTPTNGQNLVSDRFKSAITGGLTFGVMGGVARYIAPAPEVANSLATQIKIGSISGAFGGFAGALGTSALNRQMESPTQILSTVAYNAAFGALFGVGGHFVDTVTSKLGNSYQRPDVPQELGSVTMSSSDSTPILKFNTDQPKVMEAFGANARAIPSMSVVDGKLYQHVSVVDAHNPEYELYEKVQPSVVNLRWSDGTEGNSGTAFHIEGDYLGTAHHMVARSEGNTRGTLNVELADGREVPVTVVARDVAADVALLRFTNPIDNPPPELKLGQSSALKRYESVKAFGYPALANETVMTQGPFFEAYTSTGAGSSEAGLQTPVGSPIARLGSRANTWSGNSGGPLTNSNGEVVGVVTSGIPERAESYITAVEHLKLLIEEARQNKIPPKGLVVNSIGRVLGEGQTFKISAQKIKQ